MKKINSSIELTRIICCIFVVAIHILCDFCVVDGSLSYITIFIESFTRCAVPIFFMITGYFIFSREKSIKEVYMYFTKKIVIPSLIIIFLMFFFEAFFYKDNALSILQCLKNIDIFQIKRLVIMLLNWEIPSMIFPLWYISAIVQIYIAYPLLKYICKDTDKEKKIRIYLLLIMFIASFLLPTLYSFFPNSEYKLFAYSPIKEYYFVYILLGYELSLLVKHNSNKIKHPMIGMLFYLLGTFLCFYLTIRFDWKRDDVFNATFWASTTLNVFIQSIGLFIFFLNMKIKNEKAEKLILFFSKETFAIYLIHYPIRLLLIKYGIEAMLYHKFNFITFFFIELLLILFVSFIIIKLYAVLKRFLSYMIKLTKKKIQWLCT